MVQKKIDCPRRYPPSATPSNGVRIRMPFSLLLRNVVLAFVISGMAALVAFAILRWKQENEDMARSLSIQAGFVASSSQALFNDIGNGMDPLGELLAQLNVTRDPEVGRAPLVLFLLRHPQVGAMSIIAPDGRMLINTDVAPGHPLPDLRQHPKHYDSLVQDLATPNYVVAHTEFGLVLKNWRIAFRRTVRSSNGSPLFVLQAAIPVAHRTALWGTVDLLPGSAIGLLRDDGYQQARWPVGDPAVTYGQVSKGPLRQILLQHPHKASGLFRGRTSADGVLRMGAFTRLQYAPLTAYVSVPQSLLWERWWSHNYGVFLGFLGYLGAFGGLAHWVARREKEHSQELLSQARRDPLTELPNRFAAEELLNHEIARARRASAPVGLLFLDLDGFKDINDSLGHANGDQLLRQAARRLAQTLREEDVLARLGGDEFLVILPNNEAEAVSRVASRLIESLHAPFLLEGRQFRISASIGISLFPDDGGSAGDLLKHADTAMYDAKRRGGSRYTFYAEALGEKIRARMQLLQDLQNALEQEEFVLHYQPLVDLKTGHLVGAEALIRWNAPSRGIRPPAEFIPLAEESGLIVPMGEWVLKTACQQARQWTALRPDFRVAVNLSTRQFQDPDLSAKVEAAYREAGIKPQQLELEITESAAMLDPEASIRTLSDIKSLGVRVAIDDFGTGYSSLNYLKRIPADLIKIDKSFVDGINHDGDDMAIVRMILALADSLDHRCVAEGIETEAQYKELQAMGCCYGQGFWISKPLPLEEFARLLIDRPNPEPATPAGRKAVME